MQRKRTGLERWLYRIRYMFVMSIHNKVGHFQAHLDQIALLPDPAPYTIRSMDPKNADDLRAWVEIIADAYGDPSVSSEKAERSLKEHLFLDISDTFFVIDGEYPVGTVSIGTYREKPHVGGICRFAVRKAYQGQGLGKYLRLLGYHIHRERGIRYGEDIISMKREKSIMLVFFCGFRPQHDMRYISYTGALENINFFQRWRIRLKLNRMYREYLEIQNQRFQSNYGGEDKGRQGESENENSGASGRL